MQTKQGTGPTETSINIIKEEKRKTDLRQYVLNEYGSVLGSAANSMPGASGEDMPAAFK